jgi:hypothetical protein
MQIDTVTRIIKLVTMRPLSWLHDVFFSFSLLFIVWVTVTRSRSHGLGQTDTVTRSRSLRTWLESNVFRVGSNLWWLAAERKLTQPKLVPFGPRWSHVNAVSTASTAGDHCREIGWKSRICRIKQAHCAVSHAIYFRLHAAFYCANVSPKNDSSNGHWVTITAMENVFCNDLTRIRGIEWWLAVYWKAKVMTSIKWFSNKECQTKLWILFRKFAVRSL